MKDRSDTFRLFRALLAVAAVLGVAIRVWHLDWGLPELYEEATPFWRAWGFWNWGGEGWDFNPRFFNYPALTFYLHFLLQGAFYLLGKIGGVYSDLESFRLAFETDPAPLILGARMLGVAFDAGTIVLTATIGRRLLGVGGGVLVALVMAFNPLHVELSQQIAVDVPLTFFVVLSAFSAYRLLDTGHRRWYIATGIAVGMAAACKYTGALALPVLAAAHLLRQQSGRERLRAMVDPLFLSSVALSGLIFLMLNPHIVISWELFLADFHFEREHMALGHFGVETGSWSSAYYLFEVLPGALGWVFPFFVPLAVFFLLKGKKFEWIPLLVPVASFLLVLFFWTMRAERYFLPVLPGLVLLSVAGLTGFGERLAGQTAGPTRRSILAGVVSIALIVALAQPVLRLLGYHRGLEHPDSRQVAKTWIMEHVESTSIVAMAPLGIRLPAPYITFPIPFTAVSFDYLAPFYDARWYVDLDLVIGSDYDRGRYAKEPEKYREFLQFFYDTLETNWQRRYVVEPFEHQRGPRIWLYAPPGGVPEKFAPDLLDRLGSIRNRRLLRVFGRNLAAVLEARGKDVKAEQVREAVVSTILSRAPADESLATLDFFLEASPRHAGLLAARDSIVSSPPD
jgi:4-amino-4-deoxy-L-arabinose transferase-like glycosyltransferase